MASRQKNEDGQGSERQGGTPWLEWLSTGLGLVLAVGAIGYLVWKGIDENSGPPLIIIEVERVLAIEAGYLVEIRAENHSDRTAAKVLVLGQLKRGENTIESGEATFDYVPANAKRRGGLLFRHDPHPPFALDIRAVGFVEP